MAEVGIRPVAQWPTLLAGPMIRRVTDRRAHVFLCTSVERRAQVRLFSGRVLHDVPMSPMTQSAEVALDRIGQRLWVGVVPVDLPAGVQPGETISYDLRLLDGATDVGLFGLGLLGGTRAQVGSQYDARRARFPLGYEDRALPSFVVPPADPAQLRIAQASCRKPHGGGEKEPDALQILDAALEQAILQDPASRPQQLILTGDQIYADDVAGGLLAALTEAGRNLLGWDEVVPFASGPPWDVLLEPHWRTRFLSIKDIELKERVDDDDVDPSANHLIRFGEWCAMYLFAWSDALWRVDDGVRDDMGENVLTYDLPLEPKYFDLSRFQAALDLADTVGLVAVPARVAHALKVVEWLNKFPESVAKAWQETRPMALGYARSVCAVRRVLANVATYTMFDDHEITDDWYLNQRMRDRLHGIGVAAPKGDVGPRLLRNGLSAYAIFQHWGNVPEDFEPGRQGRQLLDKWRYTSASNPGQLAKPSQARSADTLLGITPADSPIPASGRRRDFERMRWDYAVEFPAHRLLALDTRTWRFFPPGQPFSWTSLAPLIPNPPGSASTSGAAELRQLAAAWRAAGAATNEVVMTSFGDLVDDVADVAEAIAQTRAQLTDRVVELATEVDRFLNALPSRAALAADALLDPLSDGLEAFFGSPANLRGALDALASKDAVVDQTLDYLRDLTMKDLGRGAEQLSKVLRALADFMETATVRSAAGMAYAARRAAANAGEGLWQVFTSLPTSHPAHDNVLASVRVALQALDHLTEATGIDPLAGALFREGGNRLGAGLIRDDALAFQVRDPIVNVGPDVPVTVILSPPPIFGNALVEVGQRAALMLLIAGGQAGEEELDYEAWTVNIPSMVALFEAVGELPCAIVLSGDVHYAGSSVNVVKTPRVTTRYIQLTSSSARNSIGLPRKLGRADDLLYEDDGTSIFRQADFIAFLERSSSSTLDHLKLLARDWIDSRLENFKNIPNIPGHYYENFDYWWRSSPQLTLNDVLETGQRILLAKPNSLRAWATESGWKIYAAVEAIQEFRDDPLLAVFGDFLTAGPTFRHELHRFYESIGVDPSAGLTVESTVLVDRRPDRISEYPPLAERITRGSLAYELTNGWEKRTVGHANVGLISLEMRDTEIIGVRHELRWYPHDEPVRLTNPVPRTDWFGTLHRAGWDSCEPDLARIR